MYILFSQKHKQKKKTKQTRRSRFCFLSIRTDYFRWAVVLSRPRRRGPKLRIHLLPLLLPPRPNSKLIASLSFLSFIQSSHSPPSSCLLSDHRIHLPDPPQHHTTSPLTPPHTYDTPPPAPTRRLSWTRAAAAAPAAPPRPPAPPRAPPLPPLPPPPPPPGRCAGRSRWSP